MKYSYPLSEDWSTEEMVQVIEWLNQVEKVYESHATLEELQNHYRLFKQIVTSIMEEKQIDRQFKQLSGYSTYQVVKTMKSLLKEKAPLNTMVSL
ncbi:UPF0223 family protein [Dolosicoccus paucivorans]|uniref:UPF0223 family protein n=1 Tax=Dolosicoccus paucivorans TaxID=84521 RepID=UPI000881FF34|nr:UPF0223 family protein [Dolosicoccus paucivorans]SDI42429.1 Uncharacterized protein YktA, UPF0223 family [Dolosicoccus paucivorans]